MRLDLWWSRVRGLVVWLLLLHVWRKSAVPTSLHPADLSSGAVTQRLIVVTDVNLDLVYVE